MKQERVKKDFISRLLGFFTHFSAILTATIIIGIITYIMVRGIPHLKPSLFALEYNSNNVSLLPALINTLYVIALALAIAIPLGVFTAIYLVEYAKSDSQFVKAIRLTTETLSGIPSIIYGLFGSLFFVTRLQIGLAILSGALTLAIMILPLIIRTSEEALLAIPNSYRQGSFALGAGKVRTIFRIVLPAALPSISSGIILAIGRIVGESAALIYTAGTVANIAPNIFSSGRTLAVHMYSISTEGMYLNQASATAVVLVVLIIIINILSSFVINKIGGKKSGKN